MSPAVPKRRKLAIYGGFGGINIGDELLLRAAALQARSKGYRGEILAVGPADPAPEALESDYRAFDIRPVNWRKHPLGALRQVIGRDLIIGGGQLIDGGGGPRAAAVLLSFALVAKLTGGRVMIAGVSTARLESSAVRSVYRALFRAADSIVTRDSGSLDDVLAILPSADAKSAALSDLVFGMKEGIEGAVPAAKRRIIALAVHSAPTFKLSREEEGAAFLRRLEQLMPPGLEAIVVAHDKREGWDMGLARDLVARVGSPRITARAFETADDCLAFYRQVRTIVSARMHPVIVGACAGAYCVPLAGSRKVADIGERLQLPARPMADYLALDDAAFVTAFGLGAAGPAPDEANLSDMQRAARDVIRPAA